MEKIKLGVSACLLGENTRYDGQLKLDRYIRDTLGQQVGLVPVCPEVGMGLPVPREPIRLMGERARPRLLTRETGKDLTSTMERWAAQRVGELEAEDLRGFIFKARSPSCGVAGVPLYDLDGEPSPRGTGIFARILMERMPGLVVAEESQFLTPAGREDFLRRVFAGRG